MSESDDDQTTEYALRILYQAGLALSPQGVAVNIAERTDESPSIPETQDSLDGLAERGLAERVEETYRLTERGRDYVEANVDEEGVGFVE